jgi:hypothetical protein
MVMPGKGAGYNHTATADVAIIGIKYYHETVNSML